MIYDKLKFETFNNLLVYRKEFSVSDIKTIIHSKNLDGLRIFAVFNEDKLDSFDFLSNLLFLETLEITAHGDYNFDFLYSLTNLKKLSINVFGRNIIDLQALKNLISLTIHGEKTRFVGIENCVDLKVLNLIDFKADNFLKLNSLVNLRNLTVKTSSVSSCDGLEKLISLETMLLGNCRKLKSIQKIESLINLISIEFISCPSIGNFESVGELKKLEYLNLEDCKDVQNLSFLESLPRLRKLSLLGNTTIVDGNIIPVQKIKEVFYKHRSHYNVKIENEANDKLIKKNLEKIKSMFKRN
jgi:hypothetical protein